MGRPLILIDREAEGRTDYRLNVHAVLATLAAERTGALQAGGASHAAALNSGFHLAYLVGAGLVGIALLIAIFVLRSEPMPALLPGARARPGRGR